MGKDLADAGHLVSYSLDRPGYPSFRNPIGSEHATAGGNKRLKRALFLSAFASLHHSPSTAYYDRK